MRPRVEMPVKIMREGEDALWEDESAVVFEDIGEDRVSVTLQHPDLHLEHHVTFTCFTAMLLQVAEMLMVRKRGTAP